LNSIGSIFVCWGKFTRYFKGQSILLKYIKENLSALIEGIEAIAIEYNHMIRTRFWYKPTKDKTIMKEMLIDSKDIGPSDKVCALKDAYLDQVIFHAKYEAYDTLGLRRKRAC
jgi:hypothetical protein